MSRYAHLTGPAFLAAVADSEKAHGNDDSAAEFRRRAIAWQQDQDALARHAEAADEAEGRQ